jgi:hypothetical protein
MHSRCQVLIPIEIAFTRAQISHMQPKSKLVGETELLSFQCGSHCSISSVVTIRIQNATNNLRNLAETSGWKRFQEMRRHRKLAHFETEEIQSQCASKKASY